MSKTKNVEETPLQSQTTVRDNSCSDCGAVLVFEEGIGASTSKHYCTKKGKEVVIIK